MKTTTTITARFISHTFGQFHNALSFGKVWGDAGKALVKTVLARMNALQPTEVTNLQGQPMRVFDLTLTVQEALEMIALLYSPAFVWPLEDADLDEREFIARALTYDLLLLVREEAYREMREEMEETASLFE